MKIIQRIVNLVRSRNGVNGANVRRDVAKVLIREHAIIGIGTKEKTARYNIRVLEEKFEY